MASEPATVSADEPVVLYQSVAVVICAALAAFGVVVDPGTVGTALLVVVGLVTNIVAAVKARSKVTPVA
jgi:uncharacterized membrane protein